jgi:hypothetical protein
MVPMARSGVAGEGTPIQSGSGTANRNLPGKRKPRHKGGVFEKYGNEEGDLEALRKN